MLKSRTNLHKHIADAMVQGQQNVSQKSEHTLSSAAVAGESNDQPPNLQVKERNHRTHLILTWLDLRKKWPVL